MPDYTPQAKTAISILKNKGVLINISRKDKTHNPETGETTDGQETTFSVYGVSLPIPSNKYKKKKSEGKLSDYEYFITSGEGEILQGDYFTFGGFNIKVDMVDPLNIDGNTIIIQEILCKRVASIP